MSWRDYYVIVLYPDGHEEIIHSDTNFVAVVKWRTGFLRKAARKPSMYRYPVHVYIQHQLDGVIPIVEDPIDKQEYFVHNGHYVNVNVTHRHPTVTTKTIITKTT